MKKNSVIAFLLGLAMCISLAAYEPQFAIPDATIDQNFKNAAAEIKAIDDDLSSVIASTGAIQATLDTAAQLASTQTFTAINTFSSLATFSGITSTITFSGWVDIGRIVYTRVNAGGYEARAGCGDGSAAISGGCNAVVVLKGFPTTESTSADAKGTASSNGTSIFNSWSCESSTGGGAGITAYVVCARVK